MLRAVMVTSSQPVGMEVGLVGPFFFWPVTEGTQLLTASGPNLQQLAFGTWPAGH